MNMAATGTLTATKLAFRTAIIRAIMTNHVMTAAVALA